MVAYMDHAEIGQRVRRCLPEGVMHADVAEKIGIGADAFSRSINGKRSFSSIELALLADLLDQDLHYLITGEPDPNRVMVAARHDYDPETRRRSNPGRADDEEQLASVILAYQQAYPEPMPAPSALPNSAEKARQQLGDGFVRDFADRVEERLSIDVIRIPMLSTAYSFSVAGSRVVLLKGQANWFNSNWSLAHEIGHHVLGHHGGTGSTDRDELEANRFAADLLLPVTLLKEMKWSDVEPEDLARRVWDLGISTESLRIRLSALRISPSQEVADLLSLSTFALLRRYESCLEPRQKRTHTPFASISDLITERTNASSGRRFPLSLQNVHMSKVACGELPPKTLAWMLDCEIGDLPVAAPEPENASIEELALTLGH